MIEEWKNLREQVPEGALLLIRQGDFFVMCNDDAVLASITLRHVPVFRNGDVIKMGIPAHAQGYYLEKLLQDFEVYAADYPEDFDYVLGQPAPPRTLRKI